LYGRLSVIDDFDKKIPFFKSGAPNRAPYYYLFSLAHAINEGLWLEFGTHDGTTLNLIAEIMHKYGKEDNLLYGFDSFEGLPEAWGNKAGKGHFDKQGQMPNVAWDNIRIVKGWFENTLPSFNKIKSLEGQPAAFIHIDSDLYESAKTVLEGLKNRIKPGTVIMFDQFHNGSGHYPEYKEHEYRAWAEFSEKYEVKYEWIAYVKDCLQASLIINDIKI